MATTKLFTGAPFGVQSARFDVSAAMVHSKNINPTLPEVLYSKYYLASKAHLGPGMYKFSDGCFDEEEVKKAIGTGWAKAQEATRLTQLPHFQYKPIIKEKKFFNNYPGPGNYGKGGNPYTEMEEKAWDRSHTKGIMCTTAKKSFELSTGGSGLSPGTYTFKSGMEEFLTRTVSKRGPYDLFSGDRSMPIAYGHFATPKKPSLELFSFKSFVDELNSNAKKKHGVFGKLIRNPTVPSERIYGSTPSQWPIKQTNLGPGTYDPKPIPRYELISQHPFGSSAKRVDLKYYQNFIGNTNPVGVGRYNHTKHEAKDKRQRYRSLYLAKSNRYPFDHRTKEQVMQQRITPFNKGKDFQPFDHSCESPPPISWQKCPRPGPAEKP
ncbi:ciliary microtubule-associated protein 2 isoform X3 [Sminthopsis crassicaudata]|uniref:ciliary microtubule-associated protein 2 isoform X3 n=1 Tax=Sminthopsis crassicaudata TaxID=9301 RepID=UPI003D68AA2F